jgi:hypothetical protein
VKKGGEGGNKEKKRQMNNKERKTGMMGEGKMVKTKGSNQIMNERRVENESKRMQRKLHMQEKQGQMFAFQPAGIRQTYFVFGTYKLIHYTKIIYA